MARTASSVFAVIAAVVLIAHVSAEEVTLVTFDGAAGTTHKFVTLNDPVMGGQSEATWKLDSANKVGVFNGQVNIVPKLKAPGFVETWADDGHYADASKVGADGSLVLSVRTTTPEYKGFRVSFAAGAISPTFSCAAGGSIIGSRGCYKAKFSVPAGSDFTEVVIPLKDFSDLWSSATGEQTKTCAQDSSACVTADKLAKIQAIGVWAEGVAGAIHLEVKSISVRPASSFLLASGEKLPPKQYAECSGPVQNNLRFNISSLTSPAGLSVPVDDYETLATAVCCDSRVKGFAEPRFLFASPFVNLFQNMKKDGPTTFYDPVCGIPLFEAPMGRTMQEFQADTMEHGWPSFREKEVVAGNVIIDAGSNVVRSKCGTVLGTSLPDEKGPRWCIDVSCVSGNPTQ